MYSDFKKKHTVLIVDDTPANLETLYHYFESLGFEIMMAQDGQTALKRAEYLMPNIILLDVLMPGMDGFETCVQFKSNDATKHIPIIFMTALDDTVHKVKGFQVGAADYITKPFQIEEVSARVQTQLALHNLQSKLEQQNERLQIEIQERQETAKALQLANEEQEHRVQLRTAELARANVRLKEEISERRQAELEIRKLAAELAQGIESRTNELSALYQVTALAGESLPLKDVLKQALQSVLKIANSDKGTIHLINDDPEMAAFLGFDIAEDAHIFADKFAESIIANNFGSSTNGDAPAGYFSVPIRVGNNLLGVLTIYINEKDRGSSNSNLEILLTAIADHIGIVVESIRLRRKAESAAMLEERNRLARELHDSVTQLMYSVNLFARASKDAYRLKNFQQGKKNLSRLEDTSRQALKELRLLLFELRPSELDQEGLIGALQHRLDAVEGRSGVKTQLLVDGEFRISPQLEEVLYAVAKEALNNTLKHAGATSVTIKLQSSSKQILLTIIDNGIGFDLDSNACRGGIGLATMRERTVAQRGTLLINTKPDIGTTIEVGLPIPS